MITTTISFIIVLGILIFIHELGHFAVAKLNGVGVEKFSLGFGPRLIGFRKGETEYLISLLPLGGYVKMVGEAHGEEVSEEDAKRSFTHKPVRVRSMIVAAGPIMNLVLAFLLLPLIYMIGINLPAFLDQPPSIGYVVPDHPADRAGIESGDTVLSVDGRTVADWESFFATIALYPNSPVKMTLKRDGERFTTTVTPDAEKDTGGGYAGILPPMKPVVGGVSDGYPAKEAGLQAGDVILAVDGTPISHWAELENFVHDDGAEKTFLIGRGEESFKVEITPKLNEEMNVYLIGITRYEEQVFKRFGVGESIKKGVASSFEMTSRLFLVIKGLVVGQYSLKTLGGPIMIAQVAGRAAEAGIVDLLSLVAFLSLQLGIINLFPIPVLDGGHLLFYGVEAIKGKPLSERFMGLAQQVGIALLIALMVLVTYNDIFRIFG